jgi:hypothetical protein
MALYACAAHAWLDADVLDTAITSPNTELPIIIPAASRAQRITSAPIRAAMSELNLRSRIVWETLRLIENARYRGGLSRPLGNAPQWMRAIVRYEYHPQALAAMASGTSDASEAINRAQPPVESASIPRSRKTIMKHLAETFDMMTDISAEYFGADGVWPELGVNYPTSFWESPITRQARSFIDSTFNFFVFEDIDVLWRDYVAAETRNETSPFTTIF